MSLLILMPDSDNDALCQTLREIVPSLDLRIWPEIGDPEDITFAIVWNHPPGALGQFPNLKVIASYGAGVDHIFRDTDLPENLIITRLVDNSLTRQMAEYIAGVILNRRLRLTEYREYQAASVWSPKAPRPGNKVCLLGMGNIGQAVAEYLHRLDFNLTGWSKTPKNIDHMTTYHGNEALPEAVGEADYIVCLLPLTPETENILDKSLFSKVKKGAYLINAGRGGQLHENDLLDAIGTGQLSGACLDVFKTEPLPDDHPFWRHPKIHITPHIASLTDINEAARQFIDNYRNMSRGKPLINQVDPTRKY